MPPVDGFPFVYRDTVRFRDLDGMGHVNNAVFLTYMESARIAFLSSLGAGDNPQHSLILARMEVDFRSPIAFGEEVEVGVRPSRLGTKSSSWSTSFAPTAASRRGAGACSSATTTREEQAWRSRRSGVAGWEVPTS